MTPPQRRTTGQSEASSGKELRAVSLFAGVGGFELACQRAGIEIVASVEIDKAARGVLSRRFPGARLYDDVQRVHAYNPLSHPTERCDDCLPAGRVDLVCGGFPCQDLSVAGRRAGLAGLRSGLFYELARVISELRPRWVILENVPGLLSSHGGRDMAAVVGTLGDLGYGWAYRVLDAQFFGVPQRRRRVFFVGHLGDWAAPVEVLLEPESGNGDSQACRAARPRTASASSLGIAAAIRSSNPYGDHDGAESHLVVNALTANMAGSGGGPDDNTAQGNHLVAFHMTQDYISGAVAPAMSTGNSEGCSTIGVSDCGAVRRLTPLECERLQGFPDNWTHGQSDGTRYHQMGNAVAVPVVEWIVQRLVAQELAA